MTLSQTGNHFIQCTISSAADNQVHFTGHFLNHITGIHGTLCGMNDNLIATFDKYIYDVQQFAPYLSFSRSWIKNKKKFRKNAIKGKGGLRKDFDTEEDETYNQNVDDQEQSSVKNLLTNGFINIKKVAEKLYPDHTPEGAQSQLNKKLRGDKSDSGSTYKLKSKEVKRLRHIIASYLNN